MTDDILQVVELAWAEPFLTKSDFARTHADAVAEAASRGLISTRTAPGHDKPFSRKWRVTPHGCAELFLQERND